MWYKINTFEQLEEGVKKGLMSRIAGTIMTNTDEGLIYEHGYMYKQSAARTINMSGRSLMGYLRSNKIELRSKPTIKVVKVEKPFKIDKAWSIDSVITFGKPDLYIFQFEDMESYWKYYDVIDDYSQWKPVLILTSFFEGSIFEADRNRGLFGSKSELKKFINNY